MSRVPRRTAARRRHGAAFVLPLISVFWAGELGHGGRFTGSDLFAVVALCGASGVAWQLLHRRDVVDRLTHFASAFTVVTAFLVVAAWDSSLSSAMGAGTGLGAVLVGLVYTEQLLRDRDRRQASTRATAHSLGRAS
ncbi:hypothetical protein ENKNEFLB_02306 [Nocardioides aquaticus]|uniref:SPW repeat-containing protein n=1 Tax=Nocardioides aquaticus TaxID=160826 RepID=A0ABX8EHV6_9ACTN|nr:hypothetical protein ENKNEFLB_02306 [Nocardioides aquaticus]